MKELLRRESSLKIRLSRSQQSMRQRLDHITELLEETTLRSPSATLTPVREAVANVDAEAPPPGSTLSADGPSAPRGRGAGARAARRGAGAGARRRRDGAGARPAEKDGKSRRRRTFERTGAVSG